MTRRTATLLVSSVLAAVLAVLAFVLPVPYALLRPGPVFDTLGSVGGTELITITGHTSYEPPPEDHLDLTTVNVKGGPTRVTLADALAGWFRDTTAVVPERYVFPPDESDDDVRRRNAEEMQRSQDAATLAALRQIGIPVTTTVRVNEVVRDTPAARAGLRSGDVMVSAGGAPVRSVGDLRARIARAGVGRELAIGYRRGTATRTVRVAPVAAPDGRPLIGVSLDEVNPKFPFEVRIQLENVGGPSAGLMFALGIIDKLTPGSLTGGRHVAGTGEIDTAGGVGGVGGVQQKVAAARAAGATVFLTPASNCATAVGIDHEGVTLARVATLAQAVTALAAVRAGRAPRAC